MSGLIYITDENGKLLEVIVTTLQGEDDERLQKVVTAPQAGIIGKFEPIMDAAGTVTGYNPTHGSSEANWSYNSWRIWEEIGWSPWHLFYKMETVVITEELIIDLLMQIEKVQKLPDQDQSRGEIEIGPFAATPKNALKMLMWMAVWILQPTAKYLCRGLH